MSEQNIIRRQKIKNMLYNLVAFAVIFIAFGAIIFNQVSWSLYSKLDGELTAAQKMIGNFIASGTIPDRLGEVRKGPGSGVLSGFSSPRIIPILRDQSGSVIDYGTINNAYYAQYLQDLAFDPAKLNTIIPIKIADQYYFRSLSSVVTQGGGSIYLQLLISADSEHAILSRMTLIIALSAAVFTVLSIGASFVLSQITMRPVKKAWDKQLEFVQNVSHELRTPLTIIQNTLEAIMTEPEGKIIDQSESIGLVLNETERLTRLISDMLTIARSEGTATVLSKDLFSLDMLAAAVCEPYKELAESQEKIFETQLNCPININADKSRIHQLLVILLDNAVRYTLVHDSITVKTEWADGNAIISVADTGIGIADDAREKIFDRFYRGDKARTMERTGSGLGLSIAKWIVTTHGGTIKVGHNEPKGSIFTVKLHK